MAPPSQPSKPEDAARSSSEAASRLEVTFTSLFGCLGAAVCALALVDVALVLVRQPSLAPTAPSYLAATIAAGSWLALALTVVGTVGLTVAAPLRSLWSRPWVAGLAAGLAVGAVALLLLRPWDLLERWPWVALPAAGALGGVFVGRLWSWRPLAVALAGGALLALAIDAWVLRRLYLRVHIVLFFVAVVGAALAVHRAHPGWGRRRGRGLAVGALVVVAAHLSLLTDLRGVRQAGIAHGVVQPKVFAFVHALADLDQDGGAAVFGGGDCDDLDATVRLGLCEIPGNGRDDNCNGLVDGAPAPIPATAPSPSRIRPDVYLVMVDTLRADFGGAPRATTAPEVHAFAATSLDFAHAITPYPSTFRAMIAMSQGRWWRNATPDAPMLMTWLRRLGYDTQLWIRDARLVEGDDTPVVGLVPERDPFPLGGPVPKERWSRAIIDDALAELPRPSSQPRFRWLHLLDPHAPRRRGEGPPRARYRAEVRHVSRLFGELLRALDATERGRDAVVIFMADHGEELGDHGARYHGATLYQENVAVPLVLRLPGVAPRRIDQAASLIDVAPTLAAYLGEPPLPSWQGVSWLGPVEGGRAVFTQIEPVRGLGGQGRPEMHGVIDGDHALLLNVDANLTELYDLRLDPRQTDDLSTRRPDLARPLWEHLARWQDATPCRSF